MYINNFFNVVDPSDWLYFKFTKIGGGSGSTKNLRMLNYREFGHPGSTVDSIDMVIQDEVQQIMMQTVNHKKYVKLGATRKTIKSESNVGPILCIQ